MAKEKPGANSRRRKSETHSAARLERLSRQIGMPVNDEAVDRILATIDLEGTTVLLPGVDAGKLEAATTAGIKWSRWGGSVRSMLSFLGAIVHLRKLSTPEARKKIAEFGRALVQTNDQEVALAIAKMALEQAQANAVDARAWTNERIAGEYLPQQFHALTGNPPKMTRRKMGRDDRVEITPTMRFIHAVLIELGISYTEESIIAAMQAAKKKRRKR